MLGGQAAWHAYAAELNARMALLQLHVETNWHYAVCTSCGWELELGRGHRPQFRYEVATHDCGHSLPVPAAVPAVDDLTLF